MAALEDLEARVSALEASQADYRAVLAAVNALVLRVSLGRAARFFRQRSVRVRIASRFDDRRGCVIDPRGVRSRRCVAVMLRELREVGREVCKRITAPPNQVIVFAGLPGLCAWPVLFEIQ